MGGKRGLYSTRGTEGRAGGLVKGKVERESCVVKGRAGKGRCVNRRIEMLGKFVAQEQF